MDLAREGGARPGARLSFKFGEDGPDMEVLELTQDRTVRWRCTAGPEEWVGTEVTFALAPGEKETVLRFTHSGWWEAGDFMAHCSCKWAYFLLSLKSWVEDGRGTPYPEDRKISSWG